MYYYIYTFPGLRRAGGRLDHDIASRDCFLLLILGKQLLKLMLLSFLFVYLAFKVAAASTLLQLNESFSCNFCTGTSILVPEGLDDRD